MVASDRALVTDAFRAELDRLRVDRHAATPRRGWLMRRALLTADWAGLSLAFLVSTLIFDARRGGPDPVDANHEVILFFGTLPVWLLLAKLQGLYERDGERADHSTADEVVGVVQFVTLGTWFLLSLSWVTGLATPERGRLVVFWAFAVALVIAGRSLARAQVRRSAAYAQRTVVVGAGDIGQLIARKIRQHPEYGLDLIGFVDADPRERRVEVRGIDVLGGLDQLDEITRGNDIHRVIVAFSREPDAQTMQVLRAMRERDVVVDVVPRLFDLVGPRASVHALEGLSLICVPPFRLSRSSFLVKRCLDVVVAASLLVLTAPIFLVAAISIRRSSPGPVFFRQERLGLDMEPFTILKFRTMYVDTDQDAHRDYVRSISTSSATLDAAGMYKLERSDAVTPAGRWLRKASLDELPQLINVLRGQMSLVGPRPCIPYEVETFQPHHVERFLVPQGITGLWQVSARANSTFGEALDMDVAYVRGWSLGLDLKLLLKTPFAMLRQRRATA